MSQTSYCVVALPKLQPPIGPDDYSRALAQKFRDFRLHSLKTSPEAFATTYEHESQRGLDHTFERLSNPKAVHYVALESSVVDKVMNSKDDVQQFTFLADAEWFGMIVIIGPDNEQPAGTVSARKDPFSTMTSSDTAELCHNEGERGNPQIALTAQFHLHGVYVDPQARRSGVGRAMIRTALEAGIFIAHNARAAFRCIVLVDSDNQTARSLYESAGFAMSGQETYTQQPRGLVAAEEEAKVRVALHMELHRDLS